MHRRQPRDDARGAAHSTRRFSERAKTMIDVDGEHARIAQLAPENADGVARFVHGMHWWLACRD